MARHKTTMVAAIFAACCACGCLPSRLDTSGNSSKGETDASSLDATDVYYPLDTIDAANSNGDSSRPEVSEQDTTDGSQDELDTIAEDDETSADLFDISSDDVGADVDTDDAGTLDDALDDTLVPTILIHLSEQPKKKSNERDALFAFSVDDATATCLCMLDLGAEAPCSESKFYLNISEGEHTFRITCANSAGDKGQLEFAWTIDTAPPTASLADKPQLVSTRRAPTFSFECGELNCTYECQVDHGPTEACLSPYTTLNLQPGKHTLYVTATDSFGNTQIVPTEYSWEVVTWQNVAGGGLHTCGLTSIGGLYCWGDNSFGQLGTAPVGPDVIVPRPSTPLPGTWKQIAAGFYHTCAIDSTDRLFCWGDNSYGQLGNGKAGADEFTPDPQEVSSGTSFKEIRLGTVASCARTSENKVMCWGDNEFNMFDQQIGDSPLVNPVEVPSLTDAVSFGIGSEHLCYLDSTKRIHCKGANGLGQLGRGDAEGTNEWITIAAQDWLFLRVVEESNCAIRETGTLWCWGSNQLGNLAFPPGDNLLSPKQIGTDVGWATLSGSLLANCAFKSVPGLPYCWGYNGGGLLGLGVSDMYIYVPTIVPDLDTVKTFGESQGGQSCAILSDDSLWCWGSNKNGQTGTGITDSVVTTPTRVEIL
ncbi:MAG: hypothetical protein KC609_11495 [Myxococcales bacterium]|nr:hypothetical protein [Myxococcales bacterium]